MALELIDLALTLHGRVLVAGLQAQVAPGEVLTLMGESGSGKSSLLAHIAGSLQPPLAARGRVRLDGRDLDALPIEQRRVALLFQDDLLYPHMSVLQNLLFALPRGPRAERVARAEAALAEAGLTGFGARRPHTLSGGQRARVSLLRALLAAPRVVLLDEPFSRLDAALRAQMREFAWRHLARSRVCAVLVTHDAADVPAGGRVIDLATLRPLARGDGDA
ncbi:MAG: ATP-binding cassette domain-containing protein [Burkholderiaceae bacterium]